jgi:hypothetical protein
MGNNETDTKHFSLKETLGDCGAKVLIVIIGIALALGFLLLFGKLYSTIKKDISEIYNRNRLNNRREEEADRAFEMFNRRDCPVRRHALLED